jgi:hypothetical protein
MDKPRAKPDLIIRRLYKPDLERQLAALCVLLASAPTRSPQQTDGATTQIADVDAARLSGQVAGAYMPPIP